MPRKSGRSGLARILRESVATAREAHERGRPIEEIAEERRQRSLRLVTRREFMASAGIASAGLLLSRPADSYVPTSRIVVVGGGLAGLRFAHYLWTRKSIPVSLYEAGTRLGGRCWSNRGFFAERQVAEHGGEFISTEHTSMRRLGSGLGLQLASVYGGSEPCCKDVCWLDGAYYTIAELNADLKKLQPALNAANAAAPFPTLYNNYTQAACQLDHTPATEWINRNVEGGLSSRLGRVLLTVLLSEYGCEPSIQPALNLIYLINGLGTSGLSGTDEMYHVMGGNDQIASAMAAILPSGAISTGMSLLALAKKSDGTYTCTFAKDSSTVDVSADHVVLSLPFNQLKKVDLSQAGFSAVKLAAINNYALGTNAKLALQFKKRVWSKTDHFSGTCYTDPQNFQLSWDATVGQEGDAGVLLRFPGGDAGGVKAFPGAAAHGVPPAKYPLDFLSRLDAPFPKCSAAYNGKAWLDWWVQDPLVGGAYGCYQLGNYTQFAGIENEREGNVHFCGEQTSLEFQGFMEGALRSAERLAINWPEL